MSENQCVAGASASYLHRLNPLSKLVATLPVTVFLTLVTNVWTPVAFIVASALLTVWLGRVQLFSYMKKIVVLLPFLIGFLLTYPFMIDSAAGGNQPGSQAGVLLGLTTGLRLLSLYAVMLLFALTTETPDFVRALVQNWRVNDRIGYAVLAILRFVPDMQRQHRTIRWARQVRGLNEKARKSRLSYGERVRGTTLPLLVTAIRQAERMALSMDARGFAVHPRRTYYRASVFQGEDWQFVLLFWLLSGLLVAGLAFAGLLGEISFLKMFA
ncbi:energy-coupling factor transporter transmembrane component T family protein [Brevibacillus parabrevis]|uniref:energy-coupling factor transporter transmembrane component T family protein n=1 Tax=Brevibacillus parabrevis TaxID=54914 RepID=UPI001F610CB2|nr:energy-coupling factor transporter transmembrane component T [Brevibacillus parabrevis]